jgi:hypothetical protein
LITSEDVAADFPMSDSYRTAAGINDEIAGAALQ